MGADLRILLLHAEAKNVFCQPVASFVFDGSAEWLMRQFKNWPGHNEETRSAAIVEPRDFDGLVYVSYPGGKTVTNRDAHDVKLTFVDKEQLKLIECPDEVSGVYQGLIGALAEVGEDAKFVLHWE